MYIKIVGNQGCGKSTAALEICRRFRSTKITIFDEGEQAPGELRQEAYFNPDIIIIDCIQSETIDIAPPPGT